MWNLQTYYHFNLHFQKVNQNTTDKWLIHGHQKPQGQSITKPGTPL